MLANGIHETATPGGALEVTLTAGTDDGDIRISDHFSVGETIQYVMKSSTASNDDWESGFGTVVTGNKFARTTPTATYNGTTYDNSNPSRLTFTTAVDVWITPIAGGIPEAPVQVPSAITSNSAFSGDYILSSHLQGSFGFGNAATANRLYVQPYVKDFGNEISGFGFYNNLSMAGQKCRIAIHEWGADGGIGVRLAETTDFAPTSTGWVEKSLAANVAIPAGKYWILFIVDFAGEGRYWSSESHVIAVNTSNANPVSYLYAGS